MQFDVTDPLPQLMWTCQQWGTVSFTWRNSQRIHSVKMAELHTKHYAIKITATCSVWARDVFWILHDPHMAIFCPQLPVAYLSAWIRYCQLYYPTQTFYWAMHYHLNVCLKLNTVHQPTRNAWYNNSLSDISNILSESLLKSLSNLKMAKNPVTIFRSCYDLLCVQ